MKQSELAKQLTEGMLTRDAVSRKARATSQPSSDGADNASTSRVTAVLAPGRSITLAAPGLDVDRAIELVEELLAKLRRARQQNIALRTALRVLKDQAKA